MSKLLDFERYRGKFIADQEEVLTIDWRLDKGNMYRIKVSRQRKRLQTVVSYHRFNGKFKDREIESYYMSPEFSNEFKGEAFCLKECRIGPKFNKEWKREQLVLMVAEYRKLDYLAMMEDPNVPFRVWDKYGPTSLKLANGASRFFFGTNSIGFTLTDGEGVVIEKKLYKVEDWLLRDFYGTFTDRDALQLFRDYERGRAMAKEREMLNDSNDEFLLNAAEELETIHEDPITAEGSLDEENEEINVVKEAV